MSRIIYLIGDFMKGLWLSLLLDIQYRAIDLSLDFECYKVLFKILLLRPFLGGCGYSRKLMHREYYHLYSNCINVDDDNS